MKRIIYFFIIFLFLSQGMSAQIYDFFGRNKVQYKDFDWNIMDTEHFKIFFYPEMKELAEIGAHYAEEAYERLENIFNYTIDKKIPFIFYSSHPHFQQTNVIPSFLPEGVGGFFEFLKGRVVTPHQGSLSDFKKVINHELVHVFMHAKFNGIYRAHKKYTFSGPPLWFTEGLAEAWSGEWDMQAEMVIRDAVLSGYLVPITNMYSIRGSFLMYKEGESFIRYLSEQYGDEKILLIMENFWKAKNFHAVMRMTYGGKSLKELNKEWVYYLKKKYYPVIKDEDMPSMGAEEVTSKGFNSKPVYYKSNGEEYVIFVSNRTGYTNIYMKRLKNKEGIIQKKENDDAEILIKGERSVKFEAFSLLRSKLNVSESGILTFVTKSGGRDVLHIYDIEGKKIIDTFHYDNLTSLSSPSMSPDEKKIAFSGLNEAGKKDIYIVDINTKELTRLTNDFYDDNDPSWSNGGRYVAFSSDRTYFGDDGYYNLFIYDLEKEETFYVTYGKHNDYTPVWSPDDTYLAFTSDREKSTNIWVVKTDFISRNNNYIVSNKTPVPGQLSRFTLPDRTIKKVSKLVTATFDPEWTEGGDLLFTSFENFGFHIQMIENVEQELLLEEGREILAKREVEHNEWQPEKIPGTQTNTQVYEKDYKLDIAQGQISQDPLFGSMGGAAFSVSDMLGNDYYNFLLYNNAQLSEDFFNSFNFALTRLSLARRTNYFYGLFHFDYLFYNRDYILEYSEKLYGGFFTVRYPFSQFSRIEANTTLASSDRENYYDTFRRRRAFLLSNYISYINDNSLWGPAGPLDGQRYSLTIGQTSDLVYSNVGYWTVDIDYRRYQRLTLRSALAVRAMFLMSNGREPQRYYFGGSWDLRGYRRFSLWGSRLGLISTELRYPLIDVLGIQFPFGGIAFRSLRGALFFDVGNAWEDDFNGLRGSFGTGVRLGLGFLVFRFDVGKRIENNFKDVQKGLFTQFFFGWDF